MTIRDKLTLDSNFNRHQTDAKIARITDLQSNYDKPTDPNATRRNEHPKLIDLKYN